MTSPRSPGFMPQLDGLRAAAVSAVMVHHLLDASLLPDVFAPITLGLLGVRLFFVLSGFLITGILLRGRDAVEAGSSGRSQVLRQFYVRRALRIFPLYYLVLAVAAAFGDAGTRAQLPWVATYTYNFWIATLGWSTEPFSHFWSLCVEEQFYLMWPWIVLFAPRQRLPAIATLMFALAPAYRLIAWELGFGGVAFYVVTPSSLDALGIGAVLAIASGGARVHAGLERRLRCTLLPIGLLGLAAVAGSGAWSAVLTETLAALVFAWLVAGASRGFGGTAGRMLEARPVLYLGKISYGVYVFHPFVPGVFGPVLAAAGLALPKFATFLLYTALSIGVASLSWYLFEGPINRLKDRFAPGAQASGA